MTGNVKGTILRVDGWNCSNVRKEMCFIFVELERLMYLIYLHIDISTVLLHGFLNQRFFVLHLVTQKRDKLNYMFNKYLQAYSFYLSDSCVIASNMGSHSQNIYVCVFVSESYTEIKSRGFMTK